MSAPILITDVAEMAAPSPKVSGGVLYSPLGTVLPTDSTTAPDAAFITLGRASSDGIDRTEERGNVEIQDWGGNLVAVLQDKFGITLKFKLLQPMNADVQKVAHGIKNVIATPATTTTGNTIAATINSQLLDNLCWIIDGFFQEITMRLVVPNGRITQLGPQKWVHKELVMYDITLKAFPDGTNNYAYQYWDDGQHT